MRRPRWAPGHAGWACTRRRCRSRFRTSSRTYPTTRRRCRRRRSRRSSTVRRSRRCLCPRRKARSPSRHRHSTCRLRHSTRRHRPGTCPSRTSQRSRSLSRSRLRSDSSRSSYRLRTPRTQNHRPGHPLQSKLVRSCGPFSPRTRIAMRCATHSLCHATSHAAMNRRYLGGSNWTPWAFAWPEVMRMQRAFPLTSNYAVRIDQSRAIRCSRTSRTISREVHLRHPRRIPFRARAVAELRLAPLDARR